MNYKERIQLRAEELAEEEYRQDFYALSEAKRDEVYAQAMEDVDLAERMISRAEL